MNSTLWIQKQSLIVGCGSSIFHSCPIKKKTHQTIQSRDLSYGGNLLNHPSYWFLLEDNINALMELPGTSGIPLGNSKSRRRCWSENGEYQQFHWVIVIFPWKKNDMYIYYHILSYINMLTCLGQNRIFGHTHPMLCRWPLVGKTEGSVKGPRKWWLKCPNITQPFGNHQE